MASTVDEELTAEKTGSLLPLALLALAAVVAVFLFGLPHFVQATHAAEQYQFVLVIPLVCGFLWWFLSPSWEGVTPGNSWIAGLGLALAGLLVFDAFLAHSLTNWSLALSLAVGAIIYAWGGWVLMRQVWPVWVATWLMIRPPLGLDQQLITRLQLWVSSIASLVLDTVGVIHVQEGNIIHLQKQPLFVAEACSGVNSLFVTFSALVIGLMLFRRSWPHTIGLFVLGFMAVMWVNAFRVVCLTWFHWHSDAWGDFFDQDIPHTAFGLFCFALLIALLFSCDAFLYLVVDRVLNFLPVNFVKRWLRPTPLDFDRPAPPKLTTAQANALLEQGGRRRLVCVLVGFGALACLQLAATASAYARGAVDSLDTTVDPLAARLKADSLPAEFDGWQRINFRQESRGMEFTEANFSSSWEYKRGSDDQLIVYIHRPYTDFHQLQACYSGTGWNLENQQGALLEPEGIQYVSLNILRSPDGSFGLAFTFGDLANSRWLAPPVTLQSNSLSQRLTNSLSYRLDALRGLFGRRVQQTVVSSAIVVQVHTTFGEARDRELAVSYLRQLSTQLFPQLSSSLKQ